MKVEMPHNSTLWVKVGDLHFRLTHFSHMKGETFRIVDVKKGEENVVYERDRSHSDLAEERQ